MSDLQINPEGDGSITRYVVGHEDHNAQGNITRVSASDLQQPQTQDIMSSVLSNAGSPTSRTNNPNNTVAYAGTRVTLQVAETLGLVRRDAGGNYVAVQQAPAGARQGQPAAAPQMTTQAPQEPAEAAINDSAQVPLEASEESALQELVANVPAEVTNSLLDAVSRGNLDIDYASMAADSGMTPEDLEGAVAATYAAFESQVIQKASKMGVNDFAAFTQFCQSTPENKAALQKAITNHTGARNLSGYTPLLKAFKAQSRQAAPAAPATPAPAADDSRRLIRVNGLEVTVATARRLGLIK